MARSALGLFDEAGAADRAVEALVRGGFPRGAISVFGREALAPNAPTIGGPRFDHGRAEAGAAAGAIAGGFAGLLIAIAVGTIPPTGAMILLAPVLALLVCAAFGTVVGAFVGLISGTGLPEEHAEYYREAIQHGGTVVAVVTKRQRDAQRAAGVMDASGAVDLESRVEQWRREQFHGPTPEAVPAYQL